MEQCTGDHSCKRQWVLFWKKKVQLKEEEEEIIQKTLESKQESLKIYFYPQQKGEIQIHLNIKPIATASVLIISLEETNQLYEINIPAHSLNTKIPVGKFYIPTASYHYIKIMGKNKISEAYPEIKSLQIDAITPNEIKYNKSVYLAAPSTIYAIQYLEIVQ